MNAESTARSRAEVGDEISKWTVGGGIIILALFPLALPILLLTAFAVLPLLLPALAAGLLIGIVALPMLLVRRLRRRVTWAPPPKERGRSRPWPARPGAAGRRIREI